MNPNGLKLKIFKVATLRCIALGCQAISIVNLRAYKIGWSLSSNALTSADFRGRNRQSTSLYLTAHGSGR
jgi:hypothetical protein